MLYSQILLDSYISFVLYQLLQPNSACISLHFGAHFTENNGRLCVQNDSFFELMWFSINPNHSIFIKKLVLLSVCVPCWEDRKNCSHFVFWQFQMRSKIVNHSLQFSWKKFRFLRTLPRRHHIYYLFFLIIANWNVWKCLYTLSFFRFPNDKSAMRKKLRPK